MFESSQWWNKTWNRRIELYSKPRRLPVVALFPPRINNPTERRDSLALRTARVTTSQPIPSSSSSRRWLRAAALLVDARSYVVFRTTTIRRRNKGKVVQGDFVDRSQQGVDDSRIFAEKMDHQRNINRLTRLAWNNPSRGEPNVQRFRRTTVLRYPLVDS